MSKKKICIMCTSFSTGGFISSLMPFVKEMKKANYDVDILTFKKTDYKSDLFQIIVDNTKKKDFSKREKIFFLLKSPNFVLSIVERFFLNIIIIPISLFNKMLSINEMTRYERIILNLIQKKNMNYVQSFMSMYVNEYTELCDLSDYECVISWEELFANYFLSRNVKAKRKIGFIHPDYVKANFDKSIDLDYLKYLDKIVLVSKATKNVFDREFPSLSNKSIFIYNFIDVEEIRKKSKEFDVEYDWNYFNIVTVCRLDNISKALDRGVRIINKLVKSGEKVKWHIIGDGPSKKMIETMINENELSKTIIMYGTKNNPFPYVKKADLFMLQSYYEGMPVSVNESLIIGTPVLISNYASSNEQVIDNYTGYISLNDEESLYKKLNEVINDRDDKLIEIRKNIESIDWSSYNNVKKVIEEMCK